MDQFGPTGKVSKKLVYLLRWTTFSRSNGSVFWLNGLRPETFTQLNMDCHWLILGHVALTKIKCIPIRSGYITAHNQSMVESGMTKENA